MKNMFQHLQLILQHSEISFRIDVRIHVQHLTCCTYKSALFIVIHEGVKLRGLGVIYPALGSPHKTARVCTPSTSSFDWRDSINVARPMNNEPLIDPIARALVRAGLICKLLFADG